MWDLRKNEKLKQTTDTWRDIETRAKSKFANTVSSPSHAFGRCIGRAASGDTSSRYVASRLHRTGKLSIGQTEDAILPDISRYSKTVFEILAAVSRHGGETKAQELDVPDSRKDYFTGAISASIGYRRDIMIRYSLTETGAERNF